jgi:hypothetical protein
MRLCELKAKEVSKPPAPEQMFTLAGSVVCLAKDQGKKKASSRAERAHILLPKSLESRVEDEEGEYTHHVTHRFIGRVARTQYRRWSMRLMEPYWVNSADESVSYRSTFAFEWTDKNVVMAAKRIRTDMSELDDYVPDLDLQPVTPDFDTLQPDFLGALVQYGAMTGADCDRLIEDVREFGARSVRELHYSH